VQETFTKAYQNLDRFKGDSSFYTWIYRIAVNVCIDHQRREAKMPLVTTELRDGMDRIEPELPASVMDGGEIGDPFQRARDAELARGLHEAINELTPDHRAVILLREVDGLSYEEISRVLECPKGTVMSRLHYARRQLQERLRRLR
jgi:RNA polymerase sigma-70 factor, ECF subfamily